MVEGKVQGSTGSTGSPGSTGSTGSGSNEFRGFHMPMKNTLKNTLKKTEKHVLKPATSVFWRKRSFAFIVTYCHMLENHPIQGYIYFKATNMKQAKLGLKS